MTIKNDFVTPTGERFDKVVVSAAFSVKERQLAACKSSLGAIAIALDAPGQAGRAVMIGDEDSNAGTNNVTVTPAAGTIDGAASFVLDRNDQVELFVDDGVKWTRVAALRQLVDVRSRQLSIASFAAAVVTVFATLTATVLNVGTAPRAAAGDIRDGNNSTVLAVRNAANNADVVAVASDATNNLTLGGDSAFGSQAAVVRVNASSNVATHVGGVRKTFVDSSSLTLSDGVSAIYGTTSPAGSGDQRVRATFAERGRNVADNADLSLLETSANVLYLGTDPAFTAAKQVSGIKFYPTTSGNISLGIAATTYLQYQSGEEQHWVPIVGSSAGSSPYAVHGEAVIDMNNANATAAASVYAYAIIKVTSTANFTANRTLTMPLPAADSGAYCKFYRNTQGGAFAVLVKCGAAAGSATINQANGASVCCDNTTGAFTASANVIP